LFTLPSVTTVRTYHYVPPN